MKIFKFLVLISFFLAFATTFVQAKDQEVVTDVDGDELRSGARYYMVVDIASKIPYAFGPEKPGCPTGRIVLDYWQSRPVIITPVESNSTVILEDTYVTVRFSYPLVCRKYVSLVWKVGPGGFVTIGGTDIPRLFKLTKYEGEGGSNKYQLAACPDFGCWEVCRCEPVGSVAKNGVNLPVAGVVNNKLPIVFVPASEEARIAYKLPSI